MDQDLFAVHKQMLRKEFETDKVSFSPVTAGMEQIYSDDIQKLKQRHETKHKSWAWLDCRFIKSYIVLP